jgi:hypothetical protein
MEEKWQQAIMRLEPSVSRAFENVCFVERGTLEQARLKWLPPVETALDQKLGMSSEDEVYDAAGQPDRKLFYGWASLVQEEHASRFVLDRGEDSEWISVKADVEEAARQLDLAKDPLTPARRTAYDAAAKAVARPTEFFCTGDGGKYLRLLARYGTLDDLEACITVPSSGTTASGMVALRELQAEDERIAQEAEAARKRTRERILDRARTGEGTWAKFKGPGHWWRTSLPVVTPTNGRHVTQDALAFGVFLNCLIGELEPNYHKKTGVQHPRFRVVVYGGRITDGEEFVRAYLYLVIRWYHHPETFGEGTSGRDIHGRNVSTDVSVVRRRIENYYDDKELKNFSDAIRIVCASLSPEEKELLEPPPTR